MEWGDMLGRVPAGLIFICTCLSLLIPWGVYKINRILHEQGDPPWKESE